MKIKEITVNDNIQHQDVVGELKGKFKVTNISISIEIDDTESAEEAYTFARVKLEDLKDIARKDIAKMYEEKAEEAKPKTIFSKTKSPFKR